MSDFYDDILIDSESGLGLISGPEPYRMLGNDGSSQAVIYKTPFDAYAEETTGLINNDLTYAQFLRLDFTAPETANYKITCHFMWSLNAGNSDFRSKLELDNTTEIGYRRQIHEPKDAAGNGEILGVVGGGTGNTGTNQRYPATIIRVLNITQGVHFIDLDWSCSVANTEAAIYGANILVEKMQS